MSYQSDKILLGATQSSFKTVDNVPGAIGAGIIVRSKTDGTYSIAAADGLPVGISVGKDLSDIGRTAVCRRGTLVPIRLTAGLNPAIGTQVNISDTTGLAAAAGAGATGMNATYASGRIGGNGADNGLDENGTYVGVALIDFPGGL